MFGRELIREHRAAKRSRRRITSLTNTLVVAGCILGSSLRTAQAQTKPVLVLVTKDSKIQPALKRLCERASSGDLARYYRDVVWLVHTVDTPAAAARLAPGDPTDQITDQLYSVAASQTQVKSCQLGASTSSTKPPAQFLMLEVIDSKQNGETVAIRFMRPEEAPEPGGSSLEYAHHTQLGDPVDLDRFAGCLAWQLWDIPQWLNKDHSCEKRGLKVEPPLPPPDQTVSVVGSSATSSSALAASTAVQPRSSSEQTNTTNSTAQTDTHQWLPSFRSAVIGTGALGVLTGSIFGARAIDLARDCPNCAQTQYNRAMDSAHVSTVGFGLAAVAGLVLLGRWALVNEGSPASPAEHSSRAFELSATFTANQLSLEGHW